MFNRINALVVGASLAILCGHGALAQAPSPAIAAAVADPARPKADTDRDVTRHPAEVLAFAGVKPGQKIAEFIPGGGYFTRILSHAIGDRGHLYAIVFATGGDRGAKGAKDLAATHPNITVVTQTGSTFSLPEKVDIAWTTDNYHDFHNKGPEGPLDLAVFNKAVFDALKPGGVYLIEDYQTAPGAGASQTGTLHRMEKSAEVAEVIAAGFVFDGESKVLNNPKDDHTLKIFDPAIRGEADQYLLRFRKPK